LPEFQTRRERVWRIYDEGLCDLPLTRPEPMPANSTHARHLYTILVDERADGVHLSYD